MVFSPLAKIWTIMVFKPLSLILNLRFRFLNLQSVTNFKIKLSRVQLIQYLIGKD